MKITTNATLFIIYLLAIAFGAPFLPAWAIAIIMVLWIPAGFLTVYLMSRYARRIFNTTSPFGNWPDQLLLIGVVLAGVLGLLVAPIWLRILHGVNSEVRK